MTARANLEVSQAAKQEGTSDRCKCGNSSLTFEKKSPEYLQYKKSNPFDSEAYGKIYSLSATFCYLL